MPSALDDLVATLDREVAFVNEHARLPGGWGAVLDRFKLPAPEVAATGLASAQQVRLVLTALTIQAGQALEAAGQGEPQSRVLDVWDRLTKLVDEEGRAHAAYLDEHAPAKPRSKLLGNLLKNAVASVDDPFWTAFQWQRRLMVMCRSCGAPQERARDFKCAYCRGDVFRRPGDEE